MSQFTKFLVLLSFVLTMVGSSHALESQTYYSKKFESSIQKNGKVFRPGGDTKIEEGDIVVIFTLSQDVSEVERLFQVNIDFF